jgi:DNA-binding transcriptional LysR family regulator
LDLAFVALPVDPSPRIRSRLIAREPLGVALPIDHPRAGDPAIELTELADADFITLPAASGSGLREAGVAACVSAGFRPRVVQEIADPFMILTLVAAGVGVSLISDGVAQIMPAGSVFVPLSGRPAHLDHAIAWATDNPSAVLPAVLSVADAVIPTPA